MNEETAAPLPLLEPGAYTWRALLLYLPSWVAVALIGFLPVTTSNDERSDNRSIPVESTFVVETPSQEARALDEGNGTPRSDTYLPENLVYRPGRRVMDHAGMLGLNEIHALDSVLALLEGDLDLGVLTVPSLPGGEGSLESYSLAVARAWGLGGRSRDRAVLLLLARDDRRIRIETTEEVRGDLTDAECAEIIEGMATWLRADQSSDAIVEGVNGILMELAPRYTVPTQRIVSAGQGGSRPGWVDRRHTHPYHALALAGMILLQVWVGWVFFFRKEPVWILAIPMGALILGSQSTVLGFVAGLSGVFNFLLMLPMIKSLEAGNGAFGWLAEAFRNSGRSTSTGWRSSSSWSSSRSSSSGGSSGGFRGGGSSGRW